MLAPAFLLLFNLLCRLPPGAKAGIVFPVPSGVPNQLFYLQRDPNTNTVIYQLNVDRAGRLNEEEPVNAFWIRYDEHGERKELNFIQRKFAYGLTAEKLAADKFELKFAAYSKVRFFLLKSPVDKAFHVYTTIAGKQLQLERVYLRIEGGTFWVPNVRYLEFKGLNTATREPAVERVLP
ncbi:DUF4833 domain-containing protein [Hymenobacter sp. BT523]|uniref:DUF4833 domain-containing protein n=1 Tax=Hymenobacter sp. BT523 TaxID=2795725 RepID=UPI0018ED6E9A|nr:DUF4833 domain-containing protein [Hymenobacter sp. BT523]MBJ6107938.1 DUF4833 domain-containing protein [Hymenobacter sp. BT523]